jgi:polyhydroxybutyrate depolymerase
VDLHQRNPRRALALLAAIALVAGSCGGGDGESSSGGADPPPTDVAADDGVAAGDGGDDDAGRQEIGDGRVEPVASAGCGSSTAGAVVEEERSLDVDGTDRRYLRTVPDAHDGETPLAVVLDFHGLMEGAEIHAGMSDYSTLAEEEGFVAVFPHGTGEPVRWNINPNSDETDDLSYVDALLADLSEDLCIDEARVFATGLSNGAMFTSLLACERADVLAAAVMVAGIEDPEGCQPDEAIPVMALHGTADPILLFNGGVDLGAIPGMGDDDGPPATLPEPELDGDGYPAVAAAWADRNGCDPDHTDTEISDEVIHRVWDCPAGAEVEFFIVVGGGHSWPASDFSVSIAAIVGPTTFDVDATVDGWEFMKRVTGD